MDQSISFLAEAGTAKYIEFNPIRATPVTLPKGDSTPSICVICSIDALSSGGAFVIASSLVEANKYVTAGSCFNKRLARAIKGSRLYYFI